MGRVFWDPFRPLTLAKPFFSNREKGGFGAILEYRRLSQGWGCVGVWYCPGTLKRKEPVTKHLQNGIENPKKKESANFFGEVFFCWVGFLDTGKKNQIPHKNTSSIFPRRSAL